MVCIKYIRASTQDLFSIVSQFTEKDVDFVSQEERIDTSTLSGRLMLTFFAGLAQFKQTVPFSPEEMRIRS